MSREQSFPPTFDLGHPLVQQKQRWDAPDEKNNNEQYYQPPGCDTQVGAVKLVEWKPRADIHKARAVEEQVDDG